MTVMDKGTLTHAAATAVLLTGALAPEPWRGLLISTGLYALSGGVTNALAVHMLFEKVPGLYGSGVIPLQFESFKHGIRRMIMEQFFNPAMLDQFFADATEIAARLERSLADAVAALDLDSVFDALVDTLLKSNLGGMLGMIGGKGVLEGLRGPFTARLQAYFAAQFEGGQFRDRLQEAVRDSMESAAVLEKLEAMIDHRLDQMTPQMVKDIVQSMIRQHLGWLVVWGGVVGGAIGLLVALFGIWTQHS